ncbi:MAG: hypothetical protein JJU24_16735 [Natronohydrobacter sp.]|nr:hypothetical protein [Natronohydrobacter sp.]TVR47789.1 MAG: hypothetical protein EA386_06735 [Paracoccaceae bacterium]
MTLVTRKSFLEALRDPGGLPQGEIDRIDGLWPGAKAAAEQARAVMPGIGFFSPRRRAEAFVALCAELDRAAKDQGLAQEQCQLALAILRMSAARIRKAEAGFLARFPRMDSAAQASLPETAKHFLYSIHLLQQADTPDT